MSYMKNIFIGKSIVYSTGTIPTADQNEERCGIAHPQVSLIMQKTRTFLLQYFQKKKQINKTFLFIVSLSFVKKHMNRRVVNIVLNSIIFKMVFVTIGKLYRSLWS